MCVYIYIYTHVYRYVQRRYADQTRAGAVHPKLRGVPIYIYVFTCTYVYTYKYIYVYRYIDMYRDTMLTGPVHP